VDAACEVEPRGAIRPLRRLGRGELIIEPSGLRCESLNLDLAAVRTVTVERGDTLQVATEHAMWQFRLVDEQASAFRLQYALGRLRAERGGRA
jgi:hypothetical protein